MWAPPPVRDSSASSRLAVRWRSALASPDGAVAVDRPGQLGTDVAVGEGAASGREHPAPGERLHPHGPVLAPHHRHRGVDLLPCGRLQFDVGHLGPVGVQRLRAVGRTDRLQHRREGLSRVGMGPPGRRQRIHHAVYRREIPLQGGHDTLLRLVGERIAVVASRREARSGSPGLESGRIVPARGTRTPASGRPVEEDPERGRPAPECQRDP